MQESLPSTGFWLYLILRVRPPLTLRDLRGLFEGFNGLIPKVERHILSRRPSETPLPPDTPAEGTLLLSSRSHAEKVMFLTFNIYSYM